MLQILETYAPKDDDLLLVNAKSARERKAFHLWAESKGYNHISIKTRKFEDNIVYYCRTCDRSFYENEMNFEPDWSIINPGVHYGIYAICPGCRCSYKHGSRYPESMGINIRGKTFNAVLIGRKIPNLSKRETRKDQTKKLIYYYYDLKLINSIEKREFKIMAFTDFSRFLWVNGKKYLRTIKFTKKNKPKVQTLEDEPCLFDDLCQY